MLFRKTVLVLFALGVSAAPQDDDSIEPPVTDLNDDPSNDGPPIDLNDEPPADIVGDAVSGGEGLTTVTDRDPDCSGWSKWYGRARWTYVEAQVCLQHRSSETTAILNLKEAQYYWGWAWYYASEKYPFSFFGDGYIGDGKTFEFAGSDKGPSHSQELATFPRLSPGAHEVLLAYNQQGPYYSEFPIDESLKATIVVS